MKKLILLTVLVVMSLTTLAQPIVIQMTAATYKEKSESTHEWNEWEDWTPVSVIVRLDTSTMIIKINNQFKDAFKLNQIEAENKGFDTNDGDPWSEIVFLAVDKEGISCLIGLKYFDSGIMHVGISYVNIKYIYQGTRIIF